MRYFISLLGILFLASCSNAPQSIIEENVWVDVMWLSNDKGLSSYYNTYGFENGKIVRASFNEGKQRDAEIMTYFQNRVEVENGFVYCQKQEVDPRLKFSQNADGYDFFKFYYDEELDLVITGHGVCDTQQECAVPFQTGDFSFSLLFNHKLLSNSKTFYLEKDEERLAKEEYLEFYRSARKLQSQLLHKYYPGENVPGYHFKPLEYVAFYLTVLKQGYAPVSYWDFHEEYGLPTYYRSSKSQIDAIDQEFYLENADFLPDHYQKYWELEKERFY